MPGPLVSRTSVIRVFSVYLKITVNLQRYVNQSCSMPENSFNLKKYSNQCFSILGIVCLKSTVNLQKCSNHSCT